MGQKLQRIQVLVEKLTVSKGISVEPITKADGDEQEVYTKAIRKVLTSKELPLVHHEEGDKHVSIYIMTRDISKPKPKTDKFGFPIEPDLGQLDWKLVNGASKKSRREMLKLGYTSSQEFADHEDDWQSWLFMKED